MSNEVNEINDKTPICVYVTKSTPFGSAQYSAGDIAVFKHKMAASLVKQGFASFYDPTAKKMVEKAEDARPQAAGKEQVRREQARAKAQDEQSRKPKAPGK